MRAHLSRRHLLKSGALAGASLFLPTARNAHAATPPRRLVIFYTMHGTLPWLWTPSGGRSDFKLDSELLAPLAAHRDDLILLGGLDQKALDIKKVNGCGHATAQTGSLTAEVQVDQLLAGGPSIDQYIASGLRQQNGGKDPTAVPYMHLGIAMDAMPNKWSRPFHEVRNGVVRTMGHVTYSPLTAYKRWFSELSAPGGGGGSPPDLRAFEMRRKALAFASAEFRAVKNRFGSFEAERLDQHLSLLGDLDNSLRKLQDAGAEAGQASAQPAACSKPGEPPSDSPSTLYSVGRAHQAKLIQSAFACDLTRVAALFVYSDGYLNGTVHSQAHDADINAKSASSGLKQFYMEQTKLFDELLTLLKETKESDGKSMLHHTAVLWVNELAEPDHNYNNNKWIIAGQLGGYLKTGQFFAYQGNNRGGGSGPPTGDVFTTLANGMGVPTEKFGNKNATRGELTDIKA